MPEKPVLKHQFVDLQQQRETTTIGMWIFLATEVMFFGGLFAAFTVFHYWYRDAFVSASHQMALGVGSLNTAILLCSSLSMALGVHAAKAGERKRLIRFLLITILLGTTFLGCKAWEYTHHIQDHLFPGSGFVWAGSDAPHAELFFFLYFAMTGLHALHMIIGIAVLGVLVFLSGRGRFSASYYTPVELTGLYWHFVDVIWIFLFPMFYLLGRH